MFFFGRVGVCFIYPLNPDLSDNKSHTKKHWAERGCSAQCWGLCVYDYGGNRYGYKGLAELLGGGDGAVGVAGYHDVDAFEWHCAFATHGVEVANRFHRSSGLHFSN